MSAQPTSWMTPLLDLTTSLGNAGGLIVALPTYRPDLAKAIAYRLEMRFFDFREEVMSRHGAAAGAIPLVALDHCLHGLASAGGAAVFNVDALLSTKTEDERKAWLERFVRTQWPTLILLPLTLFADDARTLTDRVFVPDGDELPQQGIVSRLVH